MWWTIVTLLTSPILGGLGGFWGLFKGGSILGLIPWVVSTARTNSIRTTLYSIIFLSSAVFLAMGALLFWNEWDLQVVQTERLCREAKAWGNVDPTLRNKDMVQAEKDKADVLCKKHPLDRTILICAERLGQTIYAMGGSIYEKVGFVCVLLSIGLLLNMAMAPQIKKKKNDIEKKRMNGPRQEMQRRLERSGM